MHTPAPVLRSRRLLLSPTMSSALFHAHTNYPHLYPSHRCSAHLRLFSSVLYRFPANTTPIFFNLTKIRLLSPSNDVSLPLKNWLAESLLVQRDGHTTSRRCLSHDGSFSPDDRAALTTTTEVQEDGDAASFSHSLSCAEACDQASIPLEARKSERNCPTRRIGTSKNQSEKKRAHDGIPNLLTVPGIGPRNMEKLVAKGIGKVAELKQLYLDKVFVRAVHEAKWMNEMEISIYDSWFNPVVSVLPGLVPDGFIYLRASPDTCHERLRRRKRPEEQGVTLDYLRGLHEKHEQWLFPARTCVEGHLSVTEWPPQLIEPLPPRIRDRVFYLEGDHVHSSIQKVPALILDCEANIDFTKDFEAKADYAGQVAEFFEYVKRTKSMETKVETAQDMASSRLILPRPSGLTPYICSS